MIALKEAECCALAGTDCRPPPLRRWAGRPQLKRDPLGSNQPSTIMPNGKPGDHPITDIVIHGLAVYSPKADALIREIVQLGGQDQITDALLAAYDRYRKANLPTFESLLTKIRDGLREGRDHAPKG